MEARRCVVCNTTKNVHDLTWVYRWGVQGPRENDVCEPCVGRLLAPVLSTSRVSRRKNLRPQVNRVKTELKPENL